MKDPYILVFIGLFIVALVFRVVRGLSLGKFLSGSKSELPTCADPDLTALMKAVTDEPRKVREILRKISRGASSAHSPDLRAAYQCAGGNIALTTLKRPNLAVGFYLRALRESPGCVEALDKLQEILTAQKRLRRLEWTYWDVLGRLEEGETGSEMWSKCWSGLASIYSVSPRRVRRADAIRKAMAAYVPEVEDGSEDSSLRVIESNGTDKD